MQQQDDLTPGARGLEALLATMVPKTQVDPVAAALAAGRRLGRRRIRLWQSAFVLALAIGSALHVAPMLHEAPVSSSTTSQPLAAGRPLNVPSRPIFDRSLLMLQRVVNERGLDGLPVFRRPAVQSIHGNEIL
jgi:hypothetical protein